MWNRRRTEDAFSQAPALPARRGDWRQLPPIQRVVGDHPLINPVQRFSASLTSWRDPSYVEALGHSVGPDEPAGVIEDIARPRVADIPAPAMPVAVPPAARKPGLWSRLVGGGVQRSVEVTPAPVVVEQPELAVPELVLPTVDAPAERPLMTSAPVAEERPVRVMHAAQRAMEESLVEPVIPPEPESVPVPAPVVPELVVPPPLPPSPPRRLGLGAPLSPGSMPSIQRSTEGESPLDSGPESLTIARLPEISPTLAEAPQVLPTNAPDVTRASEEPPSVARIPDGPSPEARSAARIPDIPASDTPLTVARIPDGPPLSADPEISLVEKKSPDVPLSPVRIADTSAPATTTSDTSLPVARIFDGSPADLSLPVTKGSDSSHTETPLSVARIPDSTQADTPMPMARIPDDSQTDAPLPMAKIPDGMQTDSPLSVARIPDGTRGEDPLPVARIPDGTQTDSPSSSVRIPDRSVWTAPTPEIPLTVARIPESPVPQNPLALPGKTDESGTIGMAPETQLTVARIPEAAPTIGHNTEAPLPVATSPGTSSEMPRKPEVSLPISRTPELVETTAPLVTPTPTALQRLADTNSPPAAELAVKATSRDSESLNVAFTDQQKMVGSVEPVKGTLGASDAVKGAFADSRSAQGVQRQASVVEMATRSPAEPSSHGFPAAVPPVVSRLIGDDIPQARPEAGIDLVPVLRRAEDPVLQREDIPAEPVVAPAPEPAAPAAQATAQATQIAPPETDELVKKLFDPLLRRLKTELRLDRERRGALTDRSH